MMCSGATRPAISARKGVGIARWNCLEKNAHATISEWHSNSILCVYLDVLLDFSVNPHAN